jgi:integrase/recombinase XerD
VTQDVVDSVRSAYLQPYRGSTLRSYGYRLDRWMDWCASQAVPPLSVRRTHVEQYIRHLSVEAGRRPNSVRNDLTPVRGFYRMAYGDGFIERDPATAARRPRVLSGPRPLGLDRQDVQALLEVAGQWGGRHQAAAYLLGCLGLSNGEACSIRVEDFAKTVRGHRVLEFVGRRGFAARIPLPVSVVRALDESAQGRVSGPLMLRPDGSGPVTEKSLRTIVRNLGKGAGIAVRVLPETLRVSCIVNALDSGASVRKVADLARHLDAGWTLRYDRDRTSHDDHAVHTLAAYLSSAEELPVADEADAAAGNFA